MAEKTTTKAKATAKSETETAKTDSITLSAEELQALIAKASAEAVAKAMEGKEQKVLNVVAEEKVTLLFIGAIAKGTEVALGEIGKITKDGGVLQVNKSYFFQHINATVEALLDERSLMIIDGVTEDDKERYGLNYDESEVLTAKQYHKLLDYDNTTLLSIYKNLCEQHKQIVLKVFASALAENDGRLTIEKCKLLNAASKETNPKGDFTYIIKQLAEKLGADA